MHAAEMGIHSVGIDISEFNTRIAEVKLAKYDPKLLEREVIDIMFSG